MISEVDRRRRFFGKEIRRSKVCKLHLPPYSIRQKKCCRLIVTEMCIPNTKLLSSTECNWSLE